MVQDAADGIFYRIPQDMGVLDVFPMAIVICDFNNDHPGQVWGNRSWLRTMGKEKVEDLKQIDMTKASEGMKRFHDDVYTKVQLQGEGMGPLRRTVHAGSEGAMMVDVSFLPIRVLLPGEEKPRVLALTYHFPVQMDEGTAEAVVGQYMCERVASFALMFAQNDGKLIQQNSMSRAHFRNVTGRPDGDVSLQELLDSFVWESEKERESMVSNIEHLQLGDGAIVFERAVKRRQEEQEVETVTETWLNMRFDPTLDPTPGMKDRQALIVSGQDVSEQRKAQGDLLAMNHQQEQFFAEMAHELRTPLHCISGLAEAMQQDATCPRSLHKNVGIILSQSRRLAAMVSDIVDNAALQRKTLLIKHEHVQLYAVAQAACDTMAPLLKRGVRLCNEVPPNLPLVQADASRVFQVLVNLVANSTRFTTKGHVRLTGRRVEQPVPSVEIAVSDTGIGIPADRISSIFEAYEQVNAGTTRPYGGTGLGLALVKTLVEAHHGTVTCSSKHGGLGSGTTMAITLPLAQPFSAVKTPRSIASSRKSNLEEEEMLLAARRRELAITEEGEEAERGRKEAEKAAVELLSRVESGSTMVSEEEEDLRLSLEDQLRVLDHVALPCWVVDPATRPSPTIVWGNVTAAQLWGRERHQLRGAAALQGPLAEGSGITQEFYASAARTAVVEHFCNFVGERAGKLVVVLRQLRVAREGGAAESLWLHVGHPC